MTLRTNARLAGATFLVYIAAGVAPMAHRPGPLVGVVLSFVECFAALVLAVTLYRITCDVDRDVAMLGMMCRVGEGLLGAVGMSTKLGNMAVGATFFAVGSTLFCWLFLRGRLIPTALAWLGVLASVLLVVALPMRLAGVIPDVFWIWLPMLVFEVTLAFWLLIRGVERAPEL